MAAMVAAGCGEASENRPVGPGSGGLGGSAGNGTGAAAPTGGTAGIVGMTGGTAGISGMGPGGAGGAAGMAGAGGTAGAGGLGGAGGTAGTGDGGPAGSGGMPTEDGIGCDESVKLIDGVREDPGAHGPWEVGVRTVTIGRLTVEMYYPAAAGSTDGVTPATYDLRDWLPAQERSTIPDEASPDVVALGGSVYRDVPIDTDHGPYPAVIHIHGTSAIRIASGSTLVHWASHGFVVLAADHPGLMLHDQLAGGCLIPPTGVQDLPGDVNAELQALANPSGELAFLGDRVDTARIAINGHSQGGCVAATLSTLPGVQVVIPFSGSFPVAASSALKSLLYAGGMQDNVIGFAQPPEGRGLLIGNFVCPPFSTTSREAYVASPGPPAVKKRLLGITNGGHLAPTDLCQTNDFGKSALEEMVERGVCGVSTAAIIGIAAIFDCGPAGSTVAFDQSLPPINFATTAALEEALHCKDRSAAFAELKTRYPIAGTFEETL